MRSLLKFITPHKTIPHTPWRAEHRWQLSPVRISILFFGLAIFGLGDSLLVQGNTGNAPWTLVEANDKNYARIKILRTQCGRLERELKARAG